jgi:hypothetical protein
LRERGGEERRESGGEAGLRLGGKEGRMENGWENANAWTVTVAAGDGTEMRAIEAFIRDVVTASEHNPGVVFYVPEGFWGEVFRTAQERAGKGDLLALRFFEALDRVELRASMEGRLAEKYQVVLEKGKGGALDLRRVMEDLILLAKEVSPKPFLYLPEEVLEGVKREAMARAREGDVLALEFLERMGGITFRVMGSP